MYLILIIVQQSMGLYFTTPYLIIWIQNIKITMPKPVQMMSAHVTAFHILTAYKIQ